MEQLPNRDMTCEMKVMRSVACIAAVFLFAASVFAQKDITSIDFKNFTYQPSCAEDSGAGRSVTVKDGEYSYEKEADGYTDRFYFSVHEPVYGDLTGDGKPEAVVISVCNTGGTGNFSEGFVFALRNGKPVQIAVLPGGDRAYGGIREVWIENDELWVETNDPGEVGGACCPTLVVTSRYKLRDGKLFESARSTTRPIYPSQRVTFQKGKSGATVTLTIRGGEGAELVLRANKGQTLTVTSNEKAIGATLDGDAEVVSLGNGFRAVLSATGDHKVRLDNEDSAPVTVEITITVK